MRDDRAPMQRPPQSWSAWRRRGRAARTDHEAMHARRVIVSMAAIAAVFELLNRSLVGEVSITGAKVSDLGFLRAVAPAAEDRRPPTHRGGV
jgi:hypothetical protein